MGNVNKVIKICTMDICTELLNCWYAAFLQSMLMRGRNSGVCGGTHLVQLCVYYYTNILTAHFCTQSLCMVLVTLTVTQRLDVASDVVQ
jgi:hypothetical protein